MSDENKVLNKLDKKRLEQKRGTDSGKDYVLFIKVGEFSSSGESIRVKSRVAKRIHHFHSGIELSAFIIFDWFHNPSAVKQARLVINVELALSGIERKVTSLHKKLIY